MAKDDGVEMSKGHESAYPTTQHTSVKYEGGHRNGASYIGGGLTKREMFAAMCLQGILSACKGWPESDHALEVARRSVVHADALIAALNKDQET